jgi:hypothetical protein
MTTATVTLMMTAAASRQDAAVVAPQRLPSAGVSQPLEVRQ